MLAMRVKRALAGAVLSTNTGGWNGQAHIRARSLPPPSFPRRRATVLSVGERLSGFEDGVGGNEDLSGNGDEGELGWFATAGQGLEACGEAGAGPAGADGGHVEGLSHLG